MARVNKMQSLWWHYQLKKRTRIKTKEPEKTTRERRGKE